MDIFEYAKFKKMAGGGGGGEVIGYACGGVILTFDINTIWTDELKAKYPYAVLSRNYSSGDLKFSLNFVSCPLRFEDPFGNEQWGYKALEFYYDGNGYSYDTMKIVLYGDANSLRVGSANEYTYVKGQVYKGVNDCILWASYPIEGTSENTTGDPESLIFPDPVPVYKKEGELNG